MYTAALVDPKVSPSLISPREAVSPGLIAAPAPNAREGASFFRLRSLIELPTNERRKLRRTGCRRPRPGILASGVMEFWST